MEYQSALMIHNMDIEEHSGVTNIKGSRLSYKWIINNFNICDKEMGNFISSPSFYASKYPNIIWYLDMYPKGETADYIDYVSIFLMPVNCPVVRASFSFCIINNKMENTFCTKEITHTFNGTSGLGFPRFIKREVVLDPSRNLMLDNQLTILCTVTMGLQVENMSKNSLELFSKNNTKFRLSNELQYLLKCEQLTDVVLVANTKELKAHKVILAARSPVFLAMLQSNMKEKESCRIEINDVSFEVLSELLQYMYTGNVENMKDYSRNLLQLADKYDIKGLKLMCEEYIYNELSINNAVEILILADSYNCDILKSGVLKFIITSSKRIIETQQFKTLKKDLPSLVVDMINTAGCLNFNNE